MWSKVLNIYQLYIYRISNFTSQMMPNMEVWLDKLLLNSESNGGIFTYFGQGKLEINIT